MGGYALNDKQGIPLGREAALRPLVVTFSEGGGEDSESLESSISRPKRE